MFAFGYGVIELSGAPSGSGQEAQVDGFGGDEQGSSFGLHHHRFILELHLVGLHQLQEDTN